MVSQPVTDTSRTVILLGTFDSKGPEYAYLRQQLIDGGCDVIAVNVGILGTTDLFSVDIEADQIARAAGADLVSLAAHRDRGLGIRIMSAGAAAVVSELHESRGIAGIIGTGGSGGTGIVTAAMRSLPIGVPKVCVSTVASGNVAPYVGIKDIVMVPSIVDVSGLNAILKGVLSRAAGALCGMINAARTQPQGDRPLIAASMFGNTTSCVDRCRVLLDEHGFETLVFHATGTGGRVLESLADQNLVDGVLDITTTEWADELCGGIYTAGPERLDAPGRRGIPHLIVPGCLDMCNFGPLGTVPDIYRSAGRQLYEWSPEVTLMRTTSDENRRMGEIFARKVNEARGPVAVLIPLRGFSMLDGDGEKFCDRDADRAFIVALKQNLKPQIDVVEVDCNINDPMFADQAVEMMLSLVRSRTRC